MTKYANLDFLVYLSKKIDVEVNYLLRIFQSNVNNYVINFFFMQTAEFYASEIANGYIEAEVLESILKSLGTID